MLTETRLDMVKRGRWKRLWLVGVVLFLAHSAHAWQPAGKLNKGTKPLPKKFDKELLDLFFDDALGQLGPGQPGAGKPAATPTENPGGSDEGSEEGPNPNGGLAWSALISASTLEDEVKAQVTPAAEATKTPSTFKGGGNKPARVSYSVLATLFGVIAQYDAEVRWKKDSVGLRSLFARAGFNCKVGTDNSYKEAQLRSQDLAELIRGGSVTVPKAEAEAKWADVVNRPPLMERMRVASEERLKVWTGAKGEFDKNRAQVLHEAELLSALAKVIQDPSFEFGDDETYLGYAVEVQKASQEICESTKTSDFDRAQKAYSSLYKACNTCHEGYRSGG